MAIHHGQCQCGKVRFEADTEIKEVISCNCSRCRRLGALLSAVPADKFKLTSGKDAMTRYTFNKHAINHMFCATCGIQAFATGKLGDKDMVMVNVRCIDGLDAAALPVRMFDGARM